MSVDLFDVQVEIGSAPPGERHVVDAGELRGEMVRLSIGRTLVRIGPENLDMDFMYSNSKLLGMCRDDEVLVPCPVVVPGGADDVAPEEDQVATAIENGSGAAFIRPDYDGWRLDEWISGPLFKALEDRRLPVFCLERMVAAGELARLAGNYPDLPIICAGCNYRAQRVYLRLLETFPNIRLSIGNNYTVWLGVEQVVEKYGPERLLFGTGFPVTEAMAALTMLTYADISEEDKQLIGSGNMDSLMEGIMR